MLAERGHLLQSKPEQGKHHNRHPSEERGQRVRTSSEQRVRNQATESIPPSRTLSPTSANAMNTVSTPPSLQKSIGTIRSVPAEPVRLDTPSPRNSEEEARRPFGRSEAMPHSTLKQSSTTPSLSSHSQPPLTRNNGVIRSLSSEFGGTSRFAAPSSLAVPAAPAEDWNAAVGRANLGKSGRVIERLMGESDKLKREITSEKLKAEESRNSFKMIEGRMEAMQTEYEGKLHDAAVNKTLLKRRERQLADLRDQVTSEKERADRAVESEKSWKEAMETLREDAKIKVHEAQLYASLMEGRNKTLTGHWKDQGALLDTKIGKMTKELKVVAEERRKDDERMNMLQGLCEQQAKELAKLRAEKEGIGEAFEKYKRIQDEGLSGTKNKLLQQERDNDAILQESLRVLGELKWALNVKQNVKGARI